MNNLDFPLEIRNEKWLNCLGMILPIGFIIVGYAFLFNTTIAFSLTVLIYSAFFFAESKFNKKKKISTNELMVVSTIIVSSTSTFFSRIESFRHPSPILAFFSSVISIVFGILIIILFSFVFYAMLISVLNKKPNMIIDSDGIKINSIETVFARQIFWTDIEEVSTSMMSMTNCIDLKLKNPGAYQSTIDSQKNSIRRWFMNYLFKKSGGIVKLSSAGSNISFKDLEYLVRKNVEARRVDGEIAYNA